MQKKNQHIMLFTIHLLHVNPTRQMERFLNPFALICISIWVRAHTEHLKRGGTFKTEMFEADWMDVYRISSRQISSFFKRAVEPARGFHLVRGAAAFNQTLAKTSQK